MVNSSDVDAAVVQRLVTDPTLAALMPDGVYFNVARKDATRFVVLELLTHTDTYGFNFEAWELFGYQVKAVSLNSTGSDVNAAAARIRELLTDAVDMPIPGYRVMQSKRTTAIRYLDVDAENPSIRWQHRGGLYDVQVTTVTSTAREARALVGTR